MHPVRLLICVAAGLVLAAPSAQALPNTQDTRLLAQPAVSPMHIAFIYGGDLWLAKRDGSAVRRLTSEPGEKALPQFSPDGKLIAYTAQVDGNADVYVVPAEGGMPTRCPAANICSDCNETHVEMMAHAADPSYDPKVMHDSAEEAERALKRSLWFDWSLYFVMNGRKFHALYSTAPRPVPLPTVITRHLWTELP